MDGPLAQWYHRYQSWLDDFKGEPYKNWMVEHLEVPVLVTVLYLVLVLYVPEHVMKHRRPLRVDHLNRGWNLLLTVFSLAGIAHTGPRLYAMLRAALARAGSSSGLPRRLADAAYPALCVWDAGNFFDGPVGVFVLLFILSKLAETLDTAFLIARKKPVIFLHWYHHLTVMLYGWHAYTTTISSGLVFAVMNYAVHSVMYLYYFLCACGLRGVVRPIAPCITFLQILQMVLGAVVQAATYVLATYTDRGCQVNRQNSKLGLIMYLSYLALFVKLFYENYLGGAKKVPVRNGAAKAPQMNGHSSSIQPEKLKGAMPNKKRA